MLNRQLEYIIIHHSITSQYLSLDASAKSFSDNHRVRLDQPATILNIPYKHVSYHYLINWDGELMQTRHINEIWYHASNWEVNKHSIGICLTWNFDTDMLSEAQKNRCVLLLKELKQEFWDLKVQWHNQYAAKTCPWNNVNVEELDRLSDEPIIDNNWAVSTARYDHLSDNQIDDELEKYIFCYNLNAMSYLFSRAQKTAILRRLEDWKVDLAEWLAEQMYNIMQSQWRLRKPKI